MMGLVFERKYMQKAEFVLFHPLKEPFIKEFLKDGSEKEMNVLLQSRALVVGRMEEDFGKFVPDTIADL